MKRTMTKWMTALAIAALVIPMASLASTKNSQPPKDLGERVRHELVMLPYYYIFDDLNYRVDGNNVTLSGEVTRPTLKDDAERVVRSVPGVGTVTNNIEVLPLSPFDDQIRLRVARAIYGNQVLSRYSWGANPPIHIIVKNGQVTLTGFVANENDRNIAGIRANGVFGVFGVTNDLRIDRKG